MLLGNRGDGEVRVHIISDNWGGFDVNRGGQHGRVYRRLLPLSKPHEVEGWQVDQSRQHGEEVKGQRVLGQRQYPEMTLQRKEHQKQY